MGKIYYNGVDYSTPIVSGVSSIKGNAETTYRTGNVNLTPANLGAAPISHAVTATTYGKGTAEYYGHVKLSNTYTSSVGDASSGVAASQKALFDAYSTLSTNIETRVKVGHDWNWTKLHSIAYNKDKNKIILVIGKWGNSSAVWKLDIPIGLEGAENNLLVFNQSNGESATINILESQCVINMSTAGIIDYYISEF